MSGQSIKQQQQQQPRSSRQTRKKASNRFEYNTSGFNRNRATKRSARCKQRSEKERGRGAARVGERRAHPRRFECRLMWSHTMQPHTDRIRNRAANPPRVGSMNERVKTSLSVEFPQPFSHTESLVSLLIATIEILARN